ncbi:FadR/GntR family transcriptional regulator [Polaromonas sp. AET17H-212]|uniref:FadR/GntR family transcriptional regulator n=1 Tax=Polaromonas sp. AET17H-212 TaxID=1977061 RepID=UPI000BBBC0F1|nr:FCD domain-containing protein [Polaromonas sp. AET17H-212]
MDPVARLRDTITDNLKSGAWRAGHRIPTERDLCVQFGIGRSGVRRVLGQLKQAGLISQTVGSGTYVRDDVQSALVALNQRQTLPVSPAELMEARLALEPSIVELVVRNATSGDFARMGQCCDEAERARTLDEFEHWDGMLHEVIADAAHNSFVANVFRLMNLARAQGEWGLLKRQSVTPERRLAYQREHRALVGALRDRDLSLALELTRVHLLHVKRNLLGV